MEPKEIKTIKDLKALIASLDDNARVVGLDEDENGPYHTQLAYEVNDDGEFVLYHLYPLEF